MLQDTVAERNVTIAALEVLISSYSVLICTHFCTHYLECVNAGNSQRQGRCTYQFRGLLYQITINSYIYSATVMFIYFTVHVCMYICMYVILVCYN